jgi:hypothetical protein
LESEERGILLACVHQSMAKQLQKNIFVEDFAPSFVKKKSLSYFLSRRVEKTDEESEKHVDKSLCPGLFLFFLSVCLYVRRTTSSFDGE